MNIRKYFSGRKLIWWGLLVLVVGFIGFNIYKSKHDTSNIITEVVKEQDLVQSVLATGQVVSNTDLSLNFKGSGIVKSVTAKVGSKAKAREVLANLDQANELASLTSARGALASAQANYKKVLDGSSSEEVQVALRAVDSALVTLNNAKAQQQQLVDNAYRTLLNSNLTAVPDPSNLNDDNLIITGAYTGTIEGTYRIRLQGDKFLVLGLEKIDDVEYTISVAAPLGTKGLYVTFPAGTNASSDDFWDVDIPNKKASSYLTNLNAYSAALETKNATISSAQAAYDQAVAQYNLKVAQARPADLQAASAQVLSAQGQVQSAQSALENTIIRAPADGTITAVNIKVGELASPTTTAIVLQDVENLYLEANVSEANVALIKTEQDVEVTFDALGPDREFTAHVTTIEPASNVVSGVVNYKLTAMIDQFPELRPGMTANMSIETGSRTNVIAVSQRAVIQKNNTKYLRVVSDPKTKAYSEVEVKTGLEANGGLVEILSGVSAGAEIVTFIEEK